MSIGHQKHHKPLLKPKPNNFLGHQVLANHKYTFLPPHSFRQSTHTYIKRLSPPPFGKNEKFESTETLLAIYTISIECGYFSFVQSQIGI